MEVVLRCGRHVLVDNGVDAAALARVLAVLERLEEEAADVFDSGGSNGVAQPALNRLT
jgi:hypothetical protein